VVLISSNSTTIHPAWKQDLVDACLAGDEPLARQLADEHDSTTAYPGTKVAVARWVRRNAPTWAEDSGIRLNALMPGLIETPMSASVRQDEIWGRHIDAVPIPVGRGGRPEELAAFVAFLLGPHGSYFCGSLLLVDGGTEAVLRPDDWPRLWGS
jgi:NAD(P)-dependent dehydrogenase (short-subunit alcohol dehydrogenase family)